MLKREELQPAGGILADDQGVVRLSFCTAVDAYKIHHKIKSPCMLRR